MLDDDELALYDQPFDMISDLPTKFDGEAVVPVSVVPSKAVALGGAKGTAGAEGFFSAAVDARTLVFGLIAFLNDNVVMREINLTEQGQYVPDISVFDYIMRFSHLAQLDPVAITAAQVYLMRLLRLNPGLELDSVNVHRLVLIASMIAQKVTTDVPFANSYWAKISGLFTLEEINAMEAEFLRLVQFDLTVDRNDYIVLADRARQIAATM